MSDEPTDVTKEVSLTDGPLENVDLWAKVSKETPRKKPGFALSIGRKIDDDAPDGFRSSIYTEAATDFAADRYDTDDFEDNTPVAILLIDSDAREAVFVGVGDIAAAHYDGDDVQGKVIAIARSGDVRLKGVGAVDIAPDNLIEVTDRVEYHE